MSTQHQNRTGQIRAGIETFVRDRLQAKLDKLDEDDPKVGDLKQAHTRQNWLADAALRVSQLQAVTHSVKPIHPDARGSSAYARPTALPAHAFVGSHCLGEQYALDVVGNAAALDVYKFLQQKIGTQTFLDLCIADDADFCAALSDDKALAQEWLARFKGIVESKAQWASHTLAKQLYWPVSKDEAPAFGAFHLLAPLHPTSLSHRVYKTLETHRFGDEAKAARELRRKKEYSETVLHDYPKAAVQKMGGTKPQNISQLNSERRGETWLFASLPPTWTTIDVKPILNADSMFHAFGRGKLVRKTVRELITFVKTDPDSNQDTRQRVERYVKVLADAFFEFTGQYRELPESWTLAESCELPLHQRLWLDTVAVEEDLRKRSKEVPADIAHDVADDFASWLNERLVRQGVPVGDAEANTWWTRIKVRLQSEFKEGGIDEQA
jgi:CRISPR-associated protein Csy1